MALQAMVMVVAVRGEHRMPLPACSLAFCLSSKQVAPMIRVTIWKEGQGSCIFNSCIEKGISAGVICRHAAPTELPFSSQQSQLQEPCPLLFLVTLTVLGGPDTKDSRISAALTVVMKREFHHVRHAYK